MNDRQFINENEIYFFCRVPPLLCRPTLPFGVFSSQHIFHQFQQQTFFSAHIFNKFFFWYSWRQTLFFIFFLAPPPPPDIKWCVPKSQMRNHRK